MLLTKGPYTLKNKWQTKKGKSQKRIPRLHGNETFLHIIERIVFLRAEFSSNLTKVLQLLIFMNKLLIVLFWLRCLFNKATFILNKTGGSFWPIPRNWKLSLDSFQLNHGCKPISKHQCTMYWDCNHFIGNVGIQYIFMRTRWYQEVLQNNHFSDNTQQGKTDKGYENRPIIDHLDESFQVVFSNEPEQSIDEHMAKLKGRFFSLSCPNIIKLYNNGMGYRYNGSKNSCVQTRSQKQVSLLLENVFWSYRCHTCLHETWWSHIFTEIRNCRCKYFDRQRQ